MRHRITPSLFFLDGGFPMRHARTAVLSALVLLLLGLPHVAPAQDCPGDCDAGGEVAINELILCVNIALGSSAVSTCAACDVDGDGEVPINELIAAVNSALNGCTPVGGDEVCGDGTVNVEGETCDDGNNLGGDGCAANCTAETRRQTELDPTRAKATAQIRSLAIPLQLQGTQALTIGEARSTAVRGQDGSVIFAPNEIPVVIKAADVQFQPVPVFGLACACVRGVPVDDFGPGISGIGKIGCGSEGLVDVDFMVEQDHNTTPGSPGNGGSAAGLPDDPECDDTSSPNQYISSSACLEGSGATCSEPNNTHSGVCNSPRVITFSGGQAPRGSVLLFNSTAIALLQDGATCAESRLPNGNCRYEDYGPDCLPCTDDDLEQGAASVAPTTSGSATVYVYDVNNSPGDSIVDGTTCGGTTPCVTTASGSEVDCDEVVGNPNAPLRSTLATAFPTLDGTDVGDTLVTTTLAAKP
jgi:cysteine-rich repeat protein